MFDAGGFNCCLGFVYAGSHLGGGLVEGLGEWKGRERAYSVVYDPLHRHEDLESCGHGGGRGREGRR